MRRIEFTVVPHSTSDTLSALFDFLLEQDWGVIDAEPRYPFSPDPAVKRVFVLITKKTAPLDIITKALHQQPSVESVVMSDKDIQIERPKRPRTKK